MPRASGSNFQGGADLTTPERRQVLRTAGSASRAGGFPPGTLPGVAQDQFGRTTYYNYSDQPDPPLHRASSFLDATTSFGFVREIRNLDNPLTAGQALLAGANSPQLGAVQTLHETATEAKDQSLYVQEQILTLGQRLALTAGLTAERTTNDGDELGKFYPYTAVLRLLSDPPIRRISQ